LATRGGQIWDSPKGLQKSKNIDSYTSKIHTYCMAEILIENVPAEIYSALKATAERAGLTLQEFLLEEITRLANNYEAIKSSVKIDRSDLPKIKASAIVDAIKSGRRLDS